MPDRSRREEDASAGMKLSRREAVKTIGTIMAAVAIPFTVGNDAIAQIAGQTAAAAPLVLASEKSSAELPVSEVMTRLSTHISQAREHPLPPDVVEKSQWALLDGFAAMISGAQLPGGRAAISFTRENGGKPISTVIGNQTACDPITAALANGTIGHSDEKDDVLVGLRHPGCNVIPAAPALGEKFGISGAHFLRGIAVGYSLSISH